ncbi:MAG: GntR family transcriptional regulator [Thermaerobacter sp.]|nr:GntR family transcriptional regulator [Thermaerobacter sp.]
MKGENDTERIGRHFVHDAVYQRLRQWIIEGRLTAGTHLRDQELAQEFGVSRTPVRESLLRLEAEGLVVTQANRWTQVAPLDLNSVMRRYPIIWTLERFAITTVATDDWTVEDITRLNAHNRLLNDAIQKRDAVAAARADEAFHLGLIEKAQNPELAAVLTELKTPLTRVEIAYFQEMWSSRESIDEHAVILASLRGDAVEAAAAVERNWQRSLARIQEIVSRGGPGGGVPV